MTIRSQWSEVDALFPLEPAIDTLESPGFVERAGAVCRFTSCRYGAGTPMIKVYSLQEQALISAERGDVSPARKNKPI